MSFWELTIAYTNGGQWTPSATFCPPLGQTSCYATAPDVSCTAEHQSTTIASHQSTISHQTPYNVMSDYICEL